MKYRFYHAVRLAVGLNLDPILKRYGYYSAYTLQESEYVGTKQITTPGAWQYLIANGYEYNPVSAVKFHWETGAHDNGSFRKVDSDDREFQYHVHLFSNGLFVDFASHHERRWESGADHYRPDLDEYIQGKTDLSF